MPGQFNELLWSQDALTTTAGGNAQPYSINFGYCPKIPRRCFWGEFQLRYLKWELTKFPDWIFSIYFFQSVFDENGVERESLIRIWIHFSRYFKSKCKYRQGGRKQTKISSSGANSIKLHWPRILVVKSKLAFLLQWKPFNAISSFLEHFPSYLI